MLLKRGKAYSNFQFPIVWTFYLLNQSLKTNYGIKDL